MTIGTGIRIGFYSAILLGELILMVIARKERLFEAEPGRTVLRPFRRSAVRLYKSGLRWQSGHPRWRRGRNILLTEQVRADIGIMDASDKAHRRMTAYAVDKIMLFLMCAFAGALLGVCVTALGQTTQIREGGVLARPDYGEGDKAVRLIGTVEGEQDVYDVAIRERQYTSEETEAMFAALEQELPMRILGENRDLQHVGKDLVLDSSWEGYPFRLSYSSSHYVLLHDNGRVYNEDLAEDERADVILTVKAVYQDRSYQTQISLVIVPVERSAAERFAEDVRSALVQADEETIYGRSLQLPDQVNGVLVEWTESGQEQSMWLFLLILFAGGVLCYSKDRRLREQVMGRERQMTVDYPQVVSKMTLFLGAGMSVRNVFYKLGEDYLHARKEGGRIQYVYEEIQLLCRELDSGVAEIAAYRNFAARCRLRPYTKFISLLTQNLQKGSDTLLTALEDEASAAFVERKNLARQMGEEAGTRMLLPMMLMLIITLVIIVVPAYLGFAG